MSGVGAWRPSPAIVVAILALVACASGVALAGPAGISALSKKKVKKIADREIQRLAPGLTVANSAALDGRPASAFASSESESYHEIDAPGEPPFQNTWSNYGAGTATAAFYKDGLGIVHLRGTLSTSADATVAFTLPPGYRPSAVLTMPIGFPGGGSLTIRANGEVVPDCAGGAGCIGGIDGLSFRLS
jgi:hypothetical protein